MDVRHLGGARGSRGVHQVEEPEGLLNAPSGPQGLQRTSSHSFHKGCRIFFLTACICKISSLSSAAPKSVNGRRLSTFSWVAQDAKQRPLVGV